MKKRLAFLLALVMMLSLVACGGGGDAEGGEGEGEAQVRTVNLAVDTALNLLDPYVTNSINELGILKNFYEGLIYYNYDAATVEPRVATAWEQSEDGLVWTFTINTDIKFHNGQNVTVDDVVFSFERAMGEPIMSIYTAPIEKVEALDETTFQVTLKANSAVFLQYVSSIYILSKSFYDENNGDITKTICGTGPYKLDSVDMATGLTASAFADYYRGEASIKAIKWSVITDASATALALEAGDLDYLKIAHSQYATMSANDKLAVSLLPTTHTVWIAFNSSEGPFADPLVRQAIAYMIDREAISLACFEGLADVDSLVINRNAEGMPDYDKVLSKYTYDYNPEKGLELLAQAGYDTSKEIDLGELKSYADGHYITKACPVIQANLAQYGVKVAINAMETNAFVEDLYNGAYTMAMSGGSYGVDMSNYYQVWGSYNIGVFGGNQHYWGNAEVDELFEKAAVENDTAKRQEMYGRIMEIMYEECPGTAVGHKYEAIAHTKDLTIPVLHVDGYQMVYEWSFAE